MKLFVLEATFIVTCLNNLMVNLLYFSVAVNVHIQVSDHRVF